MRDVPAALVEDAIRDAYGLQPVGPLRELPQGIHSRAWLAETNCGRWVVKASDPASDPPGKLRAQGELYAFLRAGGIAAPELRATQWGEYVAEVVVTGRRYPLTLLRAEQLGRLDPATVTRAEVERLAATVARLHALLDQYPGRVAIMADTAKSAREWGMQPEGAFPLPADSPLRACFTAAELQRLGEVDAAVVAALTVRAPELAGLRWAVLHGDLNFEHLRPLPDGRVYLFDFGDLCWGPVAHELAQLLQCLFRDSAISLERWAELRGWTLDGYAAHTPLTAADRAAVDYFVFNRIVAQARYIVELSEREASRAGATAIRRSYGLAEWLQRT